MLNKELVNKLGITTKEIENFYQGKLTEKQETYHQREVSDNRNIIDLIHWLEYGTKSGYIAARCSKEQEETWADKLKLLIYVASQNEKKLNEIQGKLDVAESLLKVYKASE